MARIDVGELRDKVKVMYTAVAQEPHGTFHFEMGRALAERLGYPVSDLDGVPPEAIESFAGVGFHLELAAIISGERVVDLGSGSGMDAFLAAHHAGPSGEVIGIDMTDEQLTKARRLAGRDGYLNMRSRRATSRRPSSSTGGQTSSSATGSSISVTTRRPSFGRSHACSGPAEGWPSPTL
jgi:SAM-dependent methyltransferase